jgi:hypothetical protein
MSQGGRSGAVPAGSGVGRAEQGQIRGRFPPVFPQVKQVTGEGLLPLVAWFQGVAAVRPRGLRRHFRAGPPKPCRFSGRLGPPRERFSSQTGLAGTNLIPRTPGWDRFRSLSPAQMPWFGSLWRTDGNASPIDAKALVARLPRSTVCLRYSPYRLAFQRSGRPAALSGTCLEPCRAFGWQP